MSNTKQLSDGEISALTEDDFPHISGSHDGHALEAGRDSDQLVYLEGLEGWKRALDNRHFDVYQNLSTGDKIAMSGKLRTGEAETFECDFGEGFRGAQLTTHVVVYSRGHLIFRDVLTIDKAYNVFVQLGMTPPDYVSIFEERARRGESTCDHRSRFREVWAMMGRPTRYTAIGEVDTSLPIDFEQTVIAIKPLPTTVSQNKRLLRGFNAIYLTETGELHAGEVDAPQLYRYCQERGWTPPEPIADMVYYWKLAEVDADKRLAAFNEIRASMSDAAVLKTLDELWHEMETQRKNIAEDRAITSQTGMSQLERRKLQRIGQALMKGGGALPLAP
jgi:hypothetical protein